MLNDDGSFETSDEHLARLQFAVHLFKGYSKTAGSKNAAIHAACKKAHVSRDAFSVALAKHKWTERALRNHTFVKLRASGWKTQSIANLYKVNPNTVRAAIADLRARLNACERQSKKPYALRFYKDGWEGKT